MLRKRILLCTIAALALGLPSIVLGTSWCIVENPANSNPEATWASPNGESSSDILYSYLNGASWVEEIAIAEDGANDVIPSMAIDASGNRSIAWQTSDTPARIELSTKPWSGGSWSSPVVVSDVYDESRAPSATVFGSEVWVGYEVAPPTGGHVVTVALVDPGENHPRTEVRRTSSTDPLEIVIHAEDGHLWIDWIDEEGTLGWSEYLDDEWTEMETESFASKEDLPDAREMVRATVLGL